MFALKSRIVCMHWSLEKFIPKWVHLEQLSSFVWLYTLFQILHLPTITPLLTSFDFLLGMVLLMGIFDHNFWVGKVILKNKGIKTDSCWRLCSCGMNWSFLFRKEFSHLSYSMLTELIIKTFDKERIPNITNILHLKIESQVLMLEEMCLNS